MRLALVVAVIAVAACEDDRRASRRDRDDDKERLSDSVLKRDDDSLKRKLDDDLFQLKKQVAPTSTGAWECDELVRLTNCSWDKYGTSIPASARQAFDDGVKMWRDTLQNPATRQATIDACKASLDAAKPGYDALGCY